MRRYSYIFLSFALLIGMTQATIADEISQQLRQCDKYLKVNDLTSSKHGKSKTALYCYNDVLAKDSNNLKALAGLKKIEDRYVKWTKKALKIGKKNKVKQYLGSLRLANPNSQALAELEALAYPNRKPATADSSTPLVPKVAEATTEQPVETAAETSAVVETPAAETPAVPKQASIIDLGQIYENINTTECLIWPSEEAKEKGGKNGWGSFYPKEGDTGKIVTEMKHCHLGNQVYLLNIDKHYVAISGTGIKIVK
jgi:hypothetical protein